MQTPVVTMMKTTILAAVLTMASVAQSAAAEPEAVAKPAEAGQKAPAAALESAKKELLATAAEATPLPDPVARVNGVAISAADMKRARKVLAAGQGGQLKPEQAAEVDKAALSQLVSAELLYQAASKLEVRELDKKVEEKFAQGKARFANEQDFLKAIGNLDMTEKELRDYTRRDLLIANFIESVITPKAAVNDEDARKFYEQNRDKFRREASVRASHILIGVDAKATVADRKTARDKADRLKAELAAGADFAALAKANSTCPSGAQGGDLGSFGKGQMVAPFEKAAFALKPGELSDVVETQFGYHIIKLVEKKDAETIPFEEVKGRLADYLKGQKVNGAVGEFIEEARKSARIEILVK